MGGAGIWIRMNVPIVESESGNAVAPRSPGKLDLAVFDTATDILGAEGWKQSGGVQFFGTDESHSYCQYLRQQQLLHLSCYNVVFVE
jgi:hypothetical protein